MFSSASQDSVFKIIPEQASCLLLAATAWMLSFSPCETLCVCVCVIVGKCCPGDTYCSGNYQRSSFEYFARCLCVCLSVCGQIVLTQ